MIKKIVSLMISFSLVITLFPKGGFAVPARFSDGMQQFIPSSLGKITSSKIFDDGDIVINIQDLHCHAETQKKIFSILEYLDTKYGLDKVYLEGAFNIVDTSWLSELKDNKFGVKIVENLLNSGNLSGTEYYSTIKNKKNFVAGIENESLYKENIKLLGEIITLSPEIEAVCKNIEKEINSVRKDYASPKARKIQRIISLYDNKKIKTKSFYNELIRLAEDLDVSVEKYKNLSLYISLFDKTDVINNGKISGEFARFVSSLKNKLDYDGYSELFKRSNKFTDFENISYDLIKLNNKFEITKNLKLKNLESFFASLAVSDIINPIELVKEKEDFINELYIKAGRTKYEKEVNFLAEFVPVIRNYFTAEISSDEYYNFEEGYKKFKTTWPSYLPSQPIQSLDTYYDLLSKYHRNNILRDQIFFSAIRQSSDFSTQTPSRKISLVVTGGFHTRGLERIFLDKKVSYVIITPKVTESTEAARQLYTDNVLYYSSILENTINIEPLTQEPLNVSFRKVMEGFFYAVQSEAFQNYSEEDLKREIYQIIAEKIIDKQNTFYGNVEILEWQILSSEVKTGNVEFVVKYRDNANKGTESTINYIYSDGEIKEYANIDIEKTVNMIKRIKANKYAAPSLELEPATSARKKLYRYILKPLSEISGDAVSLMPYKQLHMTVGYDSSGATPQQMDESFLYQNKTHSIFAATQNLGETFPSIKTSLAGTLKLMPDGVLIYTITDTDLIAQMLNLRKDFENLDPNYRVPKIVHMTIGRIFDESLFQDTPQAKEKLAEVIRLLNEKIYEINKAGELAKIKTSFTLKGGYVSSTGDKDFLTTRIYPKSQPLVIAKNFFKNASDVVRLIYTIVVAPVIEEGIFRAAPFILLTTFVFTTPFPIIPAIVTAFTGTIGFAYAHTLNDIITKSSQKRDWKDLLSPATSLTWIYIVLSFIFPQYMLLAPIVTTVLHSIYNIRALTRGRFNDMLSVITGSKDDKNEEEQLSDEFYQTKDIEQMSDVPVVEQSVVDRIIEILSLLDGYDYAEVKKIIKNLSNLPEQKVERYKIVVEQIDAILDLVKENNRHNYQPQYYFRDGDYNDVSTVYGKLKVFCEQNGIDNWGSFYMSDFLLFSLIPFIALEDVYKSNNSFFYHMVDSLFIHKGKLRDKYIVLADVSKFIGETYKINSDFIPYGINKLLSREFISKDEDIPYQIQNNLKDYDALKQYYFAVSDGKEVDKSLSESLSNNVRVFREKALPFTAEQDRERVSEILSNMEELAEKINDGNSILLETLLEELLKIILKQEEQKEDSITYFLPFIFDFTKVKKKTGTRTVKTMLDSLIKILFDSYDVNSDNEKFYGLLDGMMDISGKFYNSEDNDIKDFGTYICNGITERLLLVVYTPIAQNTLDENSLEYVSREKTFYNVFEKLSKKNPKNISVYSYMFANTGVEDPAKRNSWNDDTSTIYGPGLNRKTLQRFVDAVYKANIKNVSIPLPEKDSLISDVEDLAEIVVDNCTLFDLSSFCNDLLGKKENGRVLAISVIKKLLLILENKNIDNKTRRYVISELVNMASTELYISLQNYNLFDINRLNELCEENNLPYFLKPVSDAFVSEMRGQYRFSRLIKYLPKDMFTSGNIILQEPPILYTVSGTTNKQNKEVAIIRDKFNTLQSILNDNNLVLSLLDGLSASKNPEKDFAELVKILSKMIVSLSLINPEHGNYARTALNNILYNLSIRPEQDGELLFTTSLTKDMIKRNMALKQWNSEHIEEITEIHTLINAVHQTSISDFKETVKDIIEIGDKAIKTVVAVHRNPRISIGYSDTGGLDRTGVELYDLSENKLNPDILDFIGRLSQNKLPRQKTAEKHEYQIDDFICMDNLLVWTTRLFAHSVDIFMNFADTDKTITISYHESDKKTGNAERIRYFSTILEKFGFFVENDINRPAGNDAAYSLKATLSTDYGFNKDMDFIDIATKVVSLFSYSVMLDWDLDELSNRYSEDSYRRTFDSLVEKFMEGDIWYGYMPNGVTGWPENKITARPQRNSLDKNWLKQVLQSLDLIDDIPEEFGFRVTQNVLDDMFNNVIERSFAVGRIFLNENGILSRNKDYDVVSYLAEAVSDDEEAAINKSKLINLIPNTNFKFKTIGYIGDLLAVSGYMKLQNGDFLSVKGLTKPSIKRLKYSVVEYVSLSGRKSVTFEELYEILRNEGFDIPRQELLSPSEQDRISNLLHRQTQNLSSPELRAVPISAGNGTYVSGYVTFDKNNVDGNSIFVAPYTTPDDVERIKTAKAIITTSGGVLSHAAITTREYHTPSVIINGASWKDKGLNILCYYSSGNPFQLGNLSIRKVKSKDKILREGSIILLNGETGHILLFDDIEDSTLKLLQSYIEKDDAENIKDFLIKNSVAENIGRIVEYIYFQTIGDTRMAQTLDMLFAQDMPQTIKDKIKELNESYIQDKVKVMNEAVTNLETTANPNIAYSIVRTLLEKLEFIKSPEYRQELDMIRKEVFEISQNTKESLIVFLKVFLKECRTMLEKYEYLPEDLNEIVGMLQLANVNEMFIPETEEDAYLQELKTDTENVINLLKLRLYGTYNYGVYSPKGDILSFDDIYERDSYKFGSKTVELAKIHRLLEKEDNVVVPEGVGISYDVFVRFFDMLGQKQQFLMLSQSFKNAINNGEYQLAQNFAKIIISLIENSKNKIKETDSLRKELEDMVLKTLGDSKYSVRSSGVGEDSANNAFAGMGETVLNVDRGNLFDALLSCWESFYSERSIKYMINSGQIVSPAVLVQTMIDVDKSGVAFSRDKYGNTTIETLYGLGEGIVSGKLTPDTITVNMETGNVLEYSVATKDYKIVSTREGVKLTFVDKGAKERTLNYEEIKQLIKVLLLLEDDVFYAVDVEFGFKDGKLFILQRRPVTTNAVNEEDVSEENVITVQHDTKYEISLSAGNADSQQQAFIHLPNPLNDTQSIPVYLETREQKSARFIIPSEYEELLGFGVLENILVNRINKDRTVLAKLNGGIFNFKSGEIGLLPVTIKEFDTSSFGQSDGYIDNIKNILSAA